MDVVRSCLSCVVLVAIASSCSQGEPLPFKYLSNLTSRWKAAELVCTATVLDVEESGRLPIVEGVKLHEYFVTAKVDHIYKGRWTKEKVTFRWLSLYWPNGPILYVGPPTDSFQSNSRYLLFLKDEAAPEAITPVMETAFPLAKEGSATQYLHLVPPENIEKFSLSPMEEERSAQLSLPIEVKSVLAAEFVAAIYAERKYPPETYFGNIAEVLGGQNAANVFGVLYSSSDPVIRGVAAKMASQWSGHKPPFEERAEEILFEVAEDESAPEFSRADAINYLAENGREDVRPYAEELTRYAKNSSAREYALRALNRIGTQNSETALSTALDDSVLTNQFLATAALQKIECRSRIDESQFRSDPHSFIAPWKAYLKGKSTVRPCKPVSGSTQPRLR